MDARKEKSRAAIVAAFSELLREEDYSKITVGDIIARAHVGRATFYGLFKSKDDLLAKLVSDICTHALDDDGTPLDDPLVQVEHILNNLWERRQGVRDHIASSFVGMVQWWAWHNFQAPKEDVAKDYLSAIKPLFN